MATADYTIKLDTDGDGVAEYDATTDVRFDRHLTIGRGRDQAREYSPPLSGVILVSLDNPTGKYSYNNPASPLYGLLKPGRLIAVDSVYATPQGYAATVLADAPYGYWRLGESSGTAAADGSGYAKTGTYTGGYTLAQTGAIGAELDGTSNTAALLNGTTGRVTIPAIALAGGAITIECWVKMTSAQDGIVLSQSSSGTYLRVFAARTPYGQIVTSAGTGTVTGTSLTLGVWYHLAITWATGDNVRLFVNGSQVATSAGTLAGTLTQTGTVEIGSFYGGIFLNGTVDEAALYNTKLSAARILAHYNAGVSQGASDTTSTTTALGRAFLRLPTEQPYRTQAQVDWDAYDGLAKLVAAENISTAMHTSILTSVAIGYVLDAAGWPAADRVIDTGATTLARWWVDGINAFEAIKQLTQTEGPGAIFYVDASGKFVFESRHYRQLTTRSTTSQATFSGAGNEPLFGTAFEYEPGLRGIVNSCVVPVRSYASTGGVLIWTPAAGELPITISPGALRIFKITTTFDAFSGLDTGVDITYSSGSASLGISRSSGKTAELHVTAGAAGCVISALTFTGTTWAISTTYVTNSISAATSISDYGLRAFPSDLIPLWIPTANEARDYCDYVVGRYKDPRPQVRFSISNANAVRLTQAFARKISDRVTIVEGTRAYLNDAFFIESVSHDISNGKNQRTTFAAEKASTNAQWVLGIAGYSELGSTTILGF